MEVIPVIDLMGGQAVHARAGDRDRYRPLQTPLCPSSDPARVLAALLALHPFRTLYIADLDAIRGQGDHVDTVARLHRLHPELHLWVDAGLGDARSLADFLARGSAHPVIGSETLQDTALLADSAIADDAPYSVLSLDFQGERFMGPAELPQRPELWPQRVVVMTLAQVGSNLGPDFARLGEFQRRAPSRSLYAAGGARDADDLRELAARGVAGVLVASALHAGRIGADVLGEFD